MSRNWENTYDVIRQFLDEQLGIYETPQFANVHRFGRESRRGPRPIIAKFIYQADLEHVLQNARKLRGKPYRINRQFPEEIEQARRSLYPKLRQLRAEGHRAKIVRDILYVDGQPYDEQGHQTPQPTGNYAQGTQRNATPPFHAFGTPSRRRPRKRGRFDSTPDRYR
ncbi:uncharacterized protein [Argopecten irradians]|uniref:uncharacterized protein n=1 Tax=Argopecten irradians TaxID=31199 RepID=UPI003710E38B